MTSLNFTEFINNKGTKEQSQTKQIGSLASENESPSSLLGFFIVQFRQFKFRPSSSARRSPQPSCPLFLCVYRGAHRLGSKFYSPANSSAARPTFLSAR